MRIPTILLLLSLSAMANGQYDGGPGRGDSQGSAITAVDPGVMFSGGAGRGEATLAANVAIDPGVMFSGGPGRGDASEFKASPLAMNLRLRMSAALQGPYDPNTGFMRDQLRTTMVLPLQEPYTSMGYMHVGGGGESTTIPVVLVSGANAVVDWVVVELRSALDPRQVVATRSALLQRDGGVVDTDGVSPVLFNAPPRHYRIAILHRNHLGVMTALPTFLTSTPSPLVDLTDPATATFGTQARRNVSGNFPASVMWAGDTSFDGVLKYTGPDNDRDLILARIGGIVPTAQTTGYFTEDVNMDGTVRYTGADNDRDPVLQNIGGVVPTAIRNEQLP